MMSASLNSVLNKANTRLNNVLGNTAGVRGVLNAAGSVPVLATNAVGGPTALPFVFAAIVVVFIILTIFHRPILAGIHSAYDSIRYAFGAPDKQRISYNPDADKSDEPVVMPPQAPQNSQANNTVIEKILPGRREVFNVSENRFTYYDAEPLCKALGAELATYEQVKEAWDTGADWCNYGWVKGQVAAYPTQADTWEKLQKGPEDQRGACGRPGVNGGHFDNPELRFGVNCYGVKPAQTQHDAVEVARRQGQPMTPGAIEYDKKVQHYRSEADHVGMLPFNDKQWDQT